MATRPKPPKQALRWLENIGSSILRNRRAGIHVNRLIRRSAVEAWPLLAMNMASNLLLASSEGLTLVVIFHAARLLNGEAERPLLQPTGILAPFGMGLAGMERGQLFLLLLLLAVFLQVMMSLARYGNGLAIGWFAAHCQGRTIPILHRHLLSLSFGCASRYQVGQLMNVVARAPQTVQTQILESEICLSNLLLVLVYLIALVLLNPWLSIVAVGMAVAIAILQRTLRPRIRSASLQQVEVNRQMAIRMTEDIQLLRLLHSSASLRSSEQRIQMGARALETHIGKLTWLTSLLEPVSDLLPVIAAAGIGGLSWFLFRGNGEQLVPNLVTFVLILQRLNIRLARMGQSFNRLAENDAPMQELDSLLDPTDKEFRRQGGSAYSGFRDRIRLESVSLRYPGRKRSALQDLNLDLPFGAKVALVGESGSGKSSLVDLLVGLYAPSSGTIRVDGIPLESLDLDDWQRHLGVVSQDVILINGTIADNIRFGMPGATSGDIAVAARKADAEAFILSLPDRYNTLVGERGFRLSGGQRQRLSMARALLRHPQLLILDEATSALDSFSEARILETIHRASQDITVLAVAHRLSSVCHSDEIVVLDQGLVVERGNHEELMRRGGRYAAMWQRQAAESGP